MPKNLTEPFRHRCVQDLSWAIQSPPLISGYIAETEWWGTEQLRQEYQICLPLLKQLDKDPDPLKAALQQAKSHRLGHYFESLIEFWLTITPSYELLLSQLPLRNEHRTLGEIDYLARDTATGKIVHIEVAVKFYLGYNDLDNMASWHGPDLRDRLDRKFDHLCRHQTQISRKYPELVPCVVDEYACILKGRLFYPPNTQTETSFTHPEHLNGHWHYHLPAPKQRHDTIYYPLQKRNWLAPLTDTSDQPTGPQRHTPTEPICYASYYSNKEQNRLFILPEDFWINVQTPHPTEGPAQQ
uniref:DUF1853 domain-containing protein n=1 Tax=uncultured Thiotrichaceae bacterium TaxID=298394 RepID=A0A6S6U6L4_9GAMM|nr:MAG: Unknown protein [uncultured Thiotrichaceae bacterium]